MRRLCIAYAMCVLCIFCLSPVTAGSAQAAEMVISGAASLTGVFTELKDIFEKKHAGLKVHVNFAASNPLLKQMQEGAPVDVFASADQVTMDRAVDSRVVDSVTRRDFARNSLVLIVPKGGRRLQHLGELKSFMRIAVGMPASVPAGRYAREALISAGLWEVLQPQIIFGNNVQQVLGYVARGEVDAGFVYATDAMQQTGKVDTIMTLSGHTPVLYPIAVATTGNDPQMGKAFLDFVLSEEAGDVLARYGFSRP